MTILQQKLIIALIALCVSLVSCSDKDEPTPEPSGIVRCKVTCDVEYPQSCQAGETIEVKLLSITVEAERSPAPYVKDVVFCARGEKLFTEEKPWTGAPLTFRTKVNREDDPTLDIVFEFKMSDNLQTYTSDIYFVRVH